MPRDAQLPMEARGDGRGIGTCQALRAKEKGKGKGKGLPTIGSSTSAAALLIGRPSA